MKKLSLSILALSALLFSACLGTDEPQHQYTLETIGFDEATLPSGYMNNQSYISKNGYVFENKFDSQYGSWAGFALSNLSDTQTPGYANQYSVYSANSNNTFAVFYYSDYDGGQTIRRTDGKDFYPYAMSVAPTTYTMLSAINGDDFSPKFTDKDTLSVEIVGLDATGKTIEDSYIKFSMLRGRTLGQFNLYMSGMYFTSFDNLSPSSGLWSGVPLYHLGKVNRIKITMTSNVRGEYGITVPTYIAIDNFTTVSMDTMSEYEKILAGSSEN
ncbi:MAG: DUF4465 domain-containing protein [Bacteroidaceae bacterium]|nr:DUF4465 domain-containing protein [Bacteroidaceae bacterium]